MAYPLDRLPYEEQPQRLPPHNLEAEEAVLGSVLLDRDVIRQIAAVVRVRDFYREKNAIVYQAMLDLDERDGRVDYLTLIDELDRTQRLAQVGGTTYIANLLGVVPTPIHADHYARIVASCAIMRRLISAGGKIATIGFQNQLDTEMALEKSEQLLADVVADVPSELAVPLADALSLYVEKLGTIAEIGRAALGTTYRVPTTYRDLDSLLGGGFGRGELVMLAGRPSMGKTSLMLEIVAATAATYRIPIVVFSLEMSAEQLVARMLAASSGIPISTLEGGLFSATQQRLLGEALGRLAELPVTIYPSPRLTFAALRSQVRRVAARNDVVMVVVDHIQLLDGEGENSVARMSAISRGLKAVAREHNVVVLALSQLNRGVEQRPDKRPILSDMRESGSLEQDADVVAMLYRQEFYEPDTERGGLADLFIRKNRSGRTGDVILIWNPETTGFKGLETIE